MEITIGSLLFFGGILGVCVCLGLLMGTGSSFRRQRQRLLEELQGTGYQQNKQRRKTDEK